MHKETRTIKVNYLARVEGEGSLFLKIKGDRVERAEVRIFEPPRFFEAFLRGRRFAKRRISRPVSAASARWPTS
jgi:sulfhydrogenase subunit alpha